MDNKIFNILFIGLVLFCLIGVVSASENITEMQSMECNGLGDNGGDSSSLRDSEIIGEFNEDDFVTVSDSDDGLLSGNGSEIIKEDEKPTDMYVNCSHEESGDGLSPETALKSINFYSFRQLAENGTVHVSEGSYEISRSSSPSINDNTRINILGQDGTVITYMWWNGRQRFHNNKTVTFINICFEVPSSEYNRIYFDKEVDGVLCNDIIHYGISLGSNIGDFNFINCTFVNTSFVSSDYEHVQPNRDGLADINTVVFENCKFLNYTYDPFVNSYNVTEASGKITPTDEFETTSMITSFECSKFIFKNCLFDNITCDAIVDSYGGHSDNYGRFDGVYIYNSSFSNCSINGVTKVRQIPYCVVSKCIYDFSVSTDVPLIGPYYINATADTPSINTSLDVVASGNNLIITLTDENHNPLVDVELEIIINGNVSYDYTDNEGKIVLNNLLGDYCFEITYPGDEYEGYAPAKALRNFTFTEPKLGTVLDAPSVSANYNSADNLVITLKDINGKVLSGKNITVKVGNINKTLITDKNGQVSVNIASLEPNVYVASISFAGDDSYIESSTSSNVIINKLSTKLVASKVTASYKVKKYLTITLKDADERILAGKKVTVKIGSISKTLTTNDKGQVSVLVSKLVPKTYAATIAFAGDTCYAESSNKVSVVVKKDSPKLIAKAKTFKLKAKSKKFSVRLKDSKNMVLKGKRISMKVNGKTYSARTNKKGIATFKLTKLSKKGIFKSKILFKGDKWYKPISKVVKIKVK